MCNVVRTIFLLIAQAGGFIFVLGSPAAYACDCSDPPVWDVRNRADVIFRGTIVALRPSAKPLGFGDTRDTGRVAVFQVDRIWKGEVGPTFEMPALEELAACWGFSSTLLKVGSDLLVYAFKVPGATSGAYIYETTICSRTALARDNPDFAELGAGHKPARSPEGQKLLILSAFVIAGAGSLISYLGKRRRSAGAARSTSSVS